MNKIKQFFFVASLGMMSLVSASCSSDDDFAQETTDDKVMRTCKLIFEGEIEKFDASTRATSSWADNDTLFIVFNSGDKKIEGKGVYDVATGVWELTHYEDLPDIASADCDVYHFKDVAGTDAANVKILFSAQTAIYGDTVGTYSKTGSEIKVKAHVKPFTGRLRFKGDPGTRFTLHGVKRYNSYLISNGTLMDDCEAEKLIVGSSGYTPYVYGTVSSVKNRIWAAYEDESYVTVCNNNVLAAGKSGFMAAPTKQNYNGWKQSLDKPFTVKGVCFLMKYVKGGTFTMGGTPEQGTDVQSNELPTHEVTLSDYYIAETETTSELWWAVKRTNPSEYENPKVQRPVHDVWPECNAFVQQIAALTGEDFAITTEAQWEFAARGGTATNHYKYSGSDDYNEVAVVDSWTTQVATKMPNELGIYDMSGNTAEWCSDNYGAYTSAAVTNPTGYGESDYSKVVRSGCALNEFRVSRRYDASAGSSDYDATHGFRIALNPKTQSAE